MQDDLAVVVLRAPAKINLGLKITGVRKDGFHELQSLFAPIALYDDIEIAYGEGLQKSKVTYFTPNNTPLEFRNDTVSRTLRILAAKISVPPVEIKITKRIPTGAGLGGGSSDAGIVLKYLYERFSPLNTDTYGSELLLNEMALKVGADVPFFLGRGASFVWGIGEKLKPIKLEPFAVLVSTPPFEILTKDAYSWFDKESELTHRAADATTSLIDGAMAPSGISGAGHYRVIELREIIKIMKNDLEKPVETRHPEVSILKKALRQWGALGSLMSGSGSSVYGVFRSLNDAVTAREKLQQNFPSTYAFFACETLI